MKLAIEFAGPVADSGRLQPGRLYLAMQPSLVVLEDPTGTAVQFALFPYPTQARYLRNHQMNYTTLEERNRMLHNALTDRHWRRSI